MLQHYAFWPLNHAAVLCVPVVLFVLAGLWSCLLAPSEQGIRKAWVAARLATSVALLFSLLLGMNAVLHAGALAPQIASLFRAGVVSVSVRLDLVSVLMLLLVTFLGWVITNYSRTYMSGDLKESRYIRCLMGTLGSVCLLVVANNLMVFFVAWVSTGLFLQGLLTLYPHRQAALIAAHKKFLATRLGDATLLAAFLIIGSHCRSFEMDVVVQRIAQAGYVPGSVHIAALLLCVSAIIACAQLPLHGWLIQVMEAPTPVSALLHAGVVNLGGFLLIRLAAVIMTTPSAMALLVVSGCLTAVISAMVMTTRISIKVNLAWSTCAQMGFMLVECGLGFYGLALLHLLAHSLYKAHAFLGSGGVVRKAANQPVHSHHGSGRGGSLVAAACAGMTIAAIVSRLWAPHHPLDAAWLFSVSIVGLAVAGAFGKKNTAGSLMVLLAAAAVTALYFGFDTLFQGGAASMSTRVSPPPATLWFVLVCFALLYLVQATVRRYPSGQLATALYPWFYAGLYMDELFTRGTFRIWPIHQAAQATQPQDATQFFNPAGASK